MDVVITTDQSVKKRKYPCIGYLDQKKVPNTVIVLFVAKNQGIALRHNNEEFCTLFSYWDEAQFTFDEKIQLNITQ